MDDLLAMKDKQQRYDVAERRGGQVIIDRHKEGDHNVVALMTGTNSAALSRRIVRLLNAAEPEPET